MKKRWWTLAYGTRQFVKECDLDSVAYLNHLRGHSHGLWIFDQIERDIHVRAYRFTARITF